MRWTQSTGMEGLGDLPGGAFGSSAIATSVDGTVIVGFGSSALGDEAFRWTLSGGMVGLGDLAGGLFQSYAQAVSADGSIVVGYGTTEIGIEAFIWDANHGMRNLRSALVSDYGLNLDGWVLSAAFGMSQDGQSIVGFGTNPDGNTEAWMARIPEPSTISFMLLVCLVVNRRAR